jgi:ribosomal protein S18 acetylase RimI-like enzyme
MPTPTHVPAASIEPARLHAAFESAFADYLIGPFSLLPAEWPSFLSRQAVDFALSRVAVLDGHVVAFAFVARREPRRWRLATMGTPAEARGRGAASALLDELIVRAGRSGVDELELEVFAQNAPALRLYRSRGFVVRHELHGYTLGPARGDTAAPAVDEVDRAAAMAWLHDAMSQLPDLPLQVTPACLANSPAALQAWQSEQAQLVFSVGEPAHVRIHSLVDRDPAQRGAAALLAALCARHAGRTITVPQLQRLDVGGRALRERGFEPLPLHQLLMCRPLAA